MPHPNGGAARRGKWARQLPAPLLFAALALPRGVSAGTPLFSASTVVKELTPDDWGMMLGSNTAWFVDLYADWCPHCMHFAPIWERVASSFQGDKRVAFAAVDCAIYNDFCASLHVDAYPTMRSFNIPGVKESFTKAGAKIHEGEYKVDEQNDLVMLLRGKLVALGPDPKGGLPVPLPGSSSATPYPRPTEPAASQHTATMRYYDALVALTYSLHQGTALAAADSQSNFFKKNITDSDLSLGGSKLKELVDWLTFLSEVLPSAEARRRLGELMSVARKAQQGPAGLLPRSDWIEALEAGGIDAVPVEAGDDPGPHFKICTTYTCGLWTLFHIITVSAAKRDASQAAEWCRDAGQVQGQAEGQGQVEALVRILGFVKTFFGCSDCQKHFVSTYNGCQFGRCQLTCVDGRGAALWLSQVHNNVTLRVAGERKLPIPELWPLKGMCPECWAHGGEEGDSEDEDKVFHYLTQAYTPAADGDLSAIGAAQGLWRKGRVVKLWSAGTARPACLFALSAVLIGFLRWRNSGRQWDDRPGYLMAEGDVQFGDQVSLCSSARSMLV